MREGLYAKLLKKMGIFREGKLDMGFLSLVLILLSIGLVMLFSASYAYSYARFINSYHFIIRQAIFAVVGVVIMFALSRVDVKVYRKMAIPLYVVSIALLVLVLALPPMVEGMDHKRWLVLGPITFQPSEIAKFAIITLFAHLSKVS